jgi:hypothetical protein
MENQSSLVTLPGLSRKLNLPTTWLKAEAAAGRLPALRIGRRILFNLAAVEAVLLERARKGEGVVYAR